MLAKHSKHQHSNLVPQHSNLKMADIDYDSFMTQLHESEDCHSLAKKYVTPEVAEKFKGSKTKLEGTLAHCIKPGMFDNFSSDNDSFILLLRKSNMQLQYFHYTVNFDFGIVGIVWYF